MCMVCVVSSRRQFKGELPMTTQPPPDNPEWQPGPPSAQQPPGPPPVGDEQPAVKKPWYRRGWVLGVGGLIIGFGIGAASAGGSSNDSSSGAAPTATTTTVTSAATATATTTTTATVTAPAPAAPSTTASAATATAPKPATSGATVGNWKVQGQLTPKNDGIGDFGLTFRVLNTSSSPDNGVFTVDVLKGQTIFTSMTCSTPQVAPGQIGTATCLSGDKFKTGWTDVTIENAF